MEVGWKELYLKCWIIKVNEIGSMHWGHKTCYFLAELLTIALGAPKSYALFTFIDLGQTGSFQLKEPNELNVSAGWCQ